MKDTDYAYCVARLRANENKMLNKTQIMKLIDSGSFDGAVNELISLGWISEKGSIGDIVKEQSEALWLLLEESVPFKDELSVLCVTNDYFNIKAAVKCHFTGDDPFMFYVRPTSLNLIELTDRVNNHKFDQKDNKSLSVLRKAYDISVSTDNGQNLEIIVDRAAIDALSEYAKAKKSRLINEVCGFLCDIANIKTAVRINILGKNRDFADEAIGNCYKLDRERLIALSISDREALYDYLISGAYGEGVRLLKENGLRFEKWCDDFIIKLISTAKYTAFGFDPVCAFYFAKLNEIKCVKIILTSLLNGLEKSTIEERIRLLYA